MEVGGHLWSSLVQPWASLHRLSQVLRFEFLQFEHFDSVHNPYGFQTGLAGHFVRSWSSGSVLQSPVVGSGAALGSLPPPAPTE